MERNVVVKNMAKATVSIVNPQYGINKRWSKRGQSMNIPYELLEQCLWETGIRRLFESGILYIENLQDKIDLGLEPADATEPVNIIILNETDMEKLWKESTMAEFKKTVAKLSRTWVDELIAYAVHNEIVEMEKIDYLKKITKKDILAGITRKRQVREAEERERLAAETRAKRDDGYRN